MTKPSRLAAPVLALLALFAATPALAWSTVPAQPSGALFYPNEAEVSVLERKSSEPLPWGGAGFVLTLPASARQDTFLLSVDGAPAGGWFPLNREQRQALFAAAGKSEAPFTTLLPENEKDPERKALLLTLSALSGEKARLEGEAAAAETRLALWRRTLEVFGQGSSRTAEGGESFSNAEEAARLDAAYARQFPALHAEMEQLVRSLAEAAQGLAEARRQLELFDRREGVEFVVVPFEGKSGPHELRYSYVIPASAGLSYRLNALPDKGEIFLAQDAALTQRSGFAWEKVELRVSTIRRDSSLKPGRIRPWTVSLAEKPSPKPVMAEAAPMAAAPQKALSRNDEVDDSQEMLARQRVPGAVGSLRPADPPEFFATEKHQGATEYATFRIWNLGWRRIDNDSPLRLALEEKTLSAAFLYTLRPSLSPKGFLTARLDLQEALELPPGVAQFAVDGAAVGRQAFSFNGRKGDIFFGSDARVSAVMRDVQRSGGEQGFFNKDQTLTRHWEITISNSRARPVRALVEEPAPDARDDSIVIKSVSTPKAESAVLEPEQGGAKVLRWNLDLKPGTAELITHKVEISAPADKNRVLQSDRPGMAQ